MRTVETFSPPPEADQTPPPPSGEESLDLPPSPLAGSTWGERRQDLPEAAQPAQEQSPGPVTAEQDSVASAEDQENRDEAELLLEKSAGVRLTVLNAGNKAVRLWERIKAGVANAKDRPGKVIKRIARDMAEASFNRKKARLESAKVGVLKEHRQEKFDRAKRKLDDREASLKERVDRMEGRKQAVKDNYERRHAEDVNFVKNAKQDKLAVKAARQGLREGGASRWEARKLTAEISKDKLASIGRVALVAELGGRVAEKAERAATKASANETIPDKLKEKQERKNALAQAANESEDKAKEIFDETLPKIQEEIDRLTEGRLPYVEAHKKYTEISNELAIYQETLSVSEGDDAAKLQVKIDDFKSQLAELHKDNNNYLDWDKSLKEKQDSYKDNERAGRAWRSKARKDRRSAERISRRTLTLEEKLAKQRAKATLARSAAKKEAAAQKRRELAKKETVAAALE